MTPINSAPNLPASITQGNQYFNTPMTMKTITTQSSALSLPVTGITKLLAYGVAYGILIAVGATGFYRLAYGIEAIVILQLLLKPGGVDLFQGVSTLLQKTLGNH